MSSIRHPVSGPILTFSLEAEMRQVRQQLTTASGRIARTLVKVGPMTVTLVAVRPGGGLQEHKAAGPVTVHVLEGEIELKVAGESWALAAGMLLSLDAEVPHAVTSPEGGVFLLTVVSPPSH